MKLLSTLTLAALLTGGAAFAATTPPSAPSAPTATPAPAPAVQPAQKHNSAMHCEKEAKAKNLTGDDEKKFVKECRGGNRSS